MEKLISLHKHWLNADAIKHVVKTKIGGNSGLPKELQEFAEIHSAFARISVFYGLIYVVIEGYLELNLSNENVDSLLAKDEFVNALRLFRNATFHYQKQATPEKALKFLELKESEHWIRELHLAFKLYFEETLPIKEWYDKLDV